MNKLLLLLAIFLCSFTTKEILKGKVVKVADGDTITILVEGNKQIKIRFDGIDAPENGQDYGEKSRLFVADLIAGKEVIVENKGTDFYGRTLGVIWIDDINVNEALLRNGLAWHYKHYSKDARLDSLEQLARKEKLNIWSMKNPIAPWDYRKNKKNTKEVKTETKVSASICGSTTKSGKPCQRKVAGGGKCWQHK